MQLSAVPGTSVRLGKSEQGAAGNLLIRLPLCSVFVCGSDC